LSLLADDDGDGWFTGASNQEIALTLVYMDVPRPGQFQVVVGDRIVPAGAELDASFDTLGGQIDIGTVVATRTLGTNVIGFQDGVARFEVPVVVNEDALDVGFVLVEETLTFRNVDERLVLESDDYTLVFSTTRTNFADPHPDDATADGDQDSINERDEFELSQTFGGIGNPQRRELLVVAASSDPGGLMRPTARREIVTRFAQRGIDLWLDNGELNGHPGYGGVWENDGPVGIYMDANADIRPLRAARLPARLDFAYVGFLDTSLAHPFSGSFGSNDARSWTAWAGPPAEPNAVWQKTLFMHQLGHCLGLCHPTDTTCDSGVLPQAERDQGNTVMAHPSESAVHIVGVLESLAQPLDYTPTQWENINL
jgi:hypothetical protein